MAYTEVNEDTFNAAAEQGIVVVDFWAPWCGPCKLFGPVFKEVSNEISAITFLKVNTDEAQALAQRFDIRSIPTVIILKSGNEVERFSGMFNKEQFTMKLKRFL